MNNRAMLLDLFKQEDDEILYWLQKCTSNQFKGIVIGALKEQDRDTRHACVDAVCDSDQEIANNGIDDVIIVQTAINAVQNCTKAVEDLKGV